MITPPNDPVTSSPMIMSSKHRPPFIVVICHGSYHTPGIYQPFVDALHSEGVLAYCPQLPTADLQLMNNGDIQTPDYDRDIPGGGYPTPADDTTVIQTLLTRLITEEQQHVVLVGHSSGAFVAAQAATPDFQAKAIRDKGGRGGVIGIFFASGILVPVGESMHSFTKPKDGSAVVCPPFARFHKHGPEGLKSAVNGPQYFFNDLDEQTAAHYASMLTVCPPMFTPLTNNAYAALPCAYLICENDKAFPAAAQEGLIKMVEHSHSVKFTVYRSPSGHAPHLACTKGMVEKVVEFANDHLETEVLR